MEDYLEIEIELEDSSDETSKEDTPTITSDQSKKKKDRITTEFDKLNQRYTEWFNQRYKSLEMVCPTACLKINYCKNRYSDIVPFEESRVRLLTYQKKVISSDYVNASHIDLRSLNGHFLNPKNLYISCQAPLSHTIPSFWLMVWENRSPIIVMLTRFFEKGRIKATPYWGPPGENVGIGNGLVLYYKNCVKINEYLTHRTFLLSKTSGEKFVSRTINHYQYQEWPDHGRPESTKTIRKLIQTINNCRYLKQKEGLGGPLVVHCSAGVGRSGTFITIDVCSRMINEQRAVNVQQIVEHLRKCRMHMVQSPEQYRFIHDVLRDESETQPGTSIFPRLVTSTRQSYSKPKRGRLLSLSAPPDICRSSWKRTSTLRKEISVPS